MINYIKLYWPDGREVSEDELILAYLGKDGKRYIDVFHGSLMTTRPERVFTNDELMAIEEEKRKKEEEEERRKEMRPRRHLEYLGLLIK